jgi:integrase/recombinase XerC
VPLLRPGEQVFTGMLEGWQAQQLARNLAFTTISKRVGVVQAFAGHADALPWEWRSQMVDEWLADLRALRGLRRSTIRNYKSVSRPAIISRRLGLISTCTQRSAASWP